MPRQPLSRPWNEREIDRLKKFLSAGHNLRSIAFKLKRTPAATERMLIQLGLPTPASLRRQPAANDKAGG